MVTIPHRAPESWGFDPDFLSNPTFLPPFIATEHLPALAPSRRMERGDLRQHLRLEPETATHLAPHHAALPGVHALYADPQRNCHALLGPAFLQLPEELLNRHLLFVGPPGTGKTTQGLVPLVSALIGDQERTLILFDPKGDLFEVVRDLARRAGRPTRRVLRLNLTDPARSIGWNPLHRGMTRSEAHGIATALVMASEMETPSDTPFWRNNSIDLITNALLGLAEDPEESLTLPRLCEIINLPRPELMTWLRGHRCHKFAAFLESGSHNGETCLTDISIRLMPLLDDGLCAVLSHAELQLPKLFQHPTVLVVEMDETRIERTRALFNVLVQQILDCGIEAASRNPDARLRFPASVVIDEFGSAIGAVPRFPIYLNTLRSRRMSVIAAIQSTAQIHGLYRADAGSVLTGFSSKIFFPNVERLDAVLASEMSGTMSVRVPGRLRTPDTLLARPVFLPEEISRPKEHPVLGRPVLAVLADTLPVQIYLTPSYRLPILGDLLAQQRKRRRCSRRRRPLACRPRSVSASAPTGSPPIAISDTTGWPKERILKRLAEVKQGFDWDNTMDSACKWWEAFENKNRRRPARVLELAEELVVREATITEFFLACVYSNVQDINANLLYMDYRRLKKAEEKAQRDDRDGDVLF